MKLLFRAVDSYGVAYEKRGCNPRYEPTHCLVFRRRWMGGWGFECETSHARFTSMAAKSGAALIRAWTEATDDRVEVLEVERIVLQP